MPNEALENFKKLFAYEDWANRETLKSMRTAMEKNASAVPEKTLQRFAHILAAGKLWHQRLINETTGETWPKFDLNKSEIQIEELKNRWNEYLNKLEASHLSSTCSYLNTKGEKWTSQISDILHHVILHSGYHRGQIAGDLRAAGFEPVLTDYIHAVRAGYVK